MKFRPALKLAACGLVALLAISLWGVTRPSPLAKQLVGVWKVSVVGADNHELMRLAEDGRIFDWDAGQAEFVASDGFWTTEGERIRFESRENGNAWQRLLGRVMRLVGVGAAAGPRVGFYEVEWINADHCRWSTQFSSGPIVLELTRQKNFVPEHME